MTTPQVNKLERFHTFILDEDILNPIQLQEIGTVGYREYIEQYIIRLDHHDHLRAEQGEYSIAATPGQIEILIEILEDMKTRMIESRG